MSRSCQSATFSSPATASTADDAGQPADPLRHDRVPLVRHRRRAFLPAAERLLDLAHLGAGEVADLEREPLERRGEKRERIEHLGVSVALEDLRRARGRLQPQPLARDSLDFGVGGGVGPHGTRELPDPHPLERALDPRPIANEPERPAGELQPEGGRLGVNAVRAPDRDRVAMLLRAGDHRGERPLDPVEHENARIADLERERGVEDVRRREAVVEPATVLPELLRHRVDERGDVVMRRCLDLGDALRRGRLGPLADRSHGLAWNDSDLGPTIERGQLDVEPSLQLRSVRPDRRHGRAGVARNHSCESSARSGRPAAAAAMSRRYCMPSKRIRAQPA